MNHLLNVVEEYKRINKCFPGNNGLWNEMFEKAYNADKESNSARSDSYNEVVPQTDLLAEKLTNQLFVMDKQKILKEKYNELKKILSKNEIDKDYKELLLLYADITMQFNDLSGRLAKILIEKNML